LKDPAIAEDIQKREAEYDENQQEAERLWRAILQKEKMEKFLDVPDLIQELKNLGFTGYAVEGDLDQRIADSSFKDPYKRFREARQELEIGMSGNTDQLKLQKLESLYVGYYKKWRLSSPILAQIELETCNGVKHLMPAWKGRFLRKQKTHDHG
jgi:hypothetical protein